MANPRPWLTRVEWDRLMKVSEARMLEAINTTRLFGQRQAVHEFAKLMVVTMCRVGELRGLRYRDCRFERRGDSKDEVLIAEVTGKRGTRTIVAPKEAAEIVKTRQSIWQGKTRRSGVSGKVPRRISGALEGSGALG